MEAPDKSPITLADSPSPKTTILDAKTAKKEGSKTSPAKNRRQNGVGVSPNGNKETLGDGLDFEDLKIDALDDSEMNGVSSLLKMQESESLKGLGFVLDYFDKDENRDSTVDGRGEVSQFGPGVGKGYPEGNSGKLIENDGSEEEEDVGDEGHEFCVGDFVWGKIRSHPWWPGRIYDPLDASDYAEKVKQSDKILVAYFGDGTFAWCNPSQLIHFENNYLDMSVQSSSKSFVNAVEEAVNEAGRLVDLKMTCSCVPKDDLIGFGRTLVANAGIKEGLLVPEAGIDKFSTALFEPAEFLPALRHIAQVASTPNMLEFTVIKNWLSAFYRAKAGYELPKYYEPQPVPGLEDDTRNWAVDSSNYNSGVEVAVRGPVEDWLSSPVSPKFGKSTEMLIRKCQGISEDRQYHRRKQKSIAKILAGQSDAEAESKEDDEAKALTELGNTATSTAKKKRRGRAMTMECGTNAQLKTEAGEVNKYTAKPESSLGSQKRQGSNNSDEEGNNKVENVDEAGPELDKSASSSGRKKRKVGDETDGKATKAVGVVAEAGANSGKAASSSRGRKRKVNNEANLDGRNDLISKPKTRKQKQVSESPAAENRVPSLDVDDLVVNKGSSENPPLRGRKKRGSASIVNDDAEARKESKDNTAAAEKSTNGGLGSPNDDGETKQQIEEGSLSRARKKSKYLSPPFTDLKRGHRKKEIEVESPRFSNEACTGEQMTKAADNLVGSSSILKSSGEKSLKKQTKEPSPGNQISDSSYPLTLIHDQNSIIDPVGLEPPANEMLSQIRFAALNPTFFKEENSLSIAAGFFSAFRSSIYSNGSNHKLYKKHQPRKSRKSQESGSEEQSLADLILPGRKSEPTRKHKNETPKSDKHKEKQAASAPDVRTIEQKSGRKTPAAALIVTFSPGSSLPSKNDLLKIYEKFGALDEGQTEMFHDHRGARIVFLRSSEAEEAFNVSQLSSPFGAASVTFQLRYLSADTKTRELKEISSSQPSPLAKEGGKTNDQSASQVSPSLVPEMTYVKQKLELMTSMLSDGRMSPGTKSKLQAEMKSLLDKVSAVVGSPSQNIDLS